MIKPRNHSPLAHPTFSANKSSDSKIPSWAIVGMGLIALMGLSYAVTGVSHSVDEINWAAIVSKVSVGATELVGGINNASGSLPGQTTGVDADTLDGHDSLFFQTSGGSSGGLTDGEFYYRQCGYLDGYQTDPLVGVIQGIGVPVTPQQCNDQGSYHDPDLCEPGDFDIGVNCYPTSFTQYEQFTGDYVYAITGMCQRVCQRP